jgi:hypothetical protein
MLAAAIAAPKISFETFAMISFPAREQTRRCFVPNAQTIGFHRRKFHHTMQSCIACEVRRSWRLRSSSGVTAEDVGLRQASVDFQRFHL